MDGDEFLAMKDSAYKLAYLDKTKMLSAARKALIAADAQYYAWSPREQELHRFDAVPDYVQLVPYLALIQPFAGQVHITGVVLYQQNLNRSQHRLYGSSGFREVARSGKYFHFRVRIRRESRPRVGQ